MPKRSATHKGVLTDKQIRFIDEYLVDFNAKQAAVRAGYSPRSAGNLGFVLLRKPEIQAAIQAKQKELANKAGITRERIIAEVARIAFSDIRQLFREDNSLKAFADMSDDAAGALAGVDVVEMQGGAEIGEGGDMKYIPMYTKKIKLWDKNSALEKLLKHLGMDEPPKPALPTAEQVADGFAGIRAAFAKRLNDQPAG